MTKTGLAFLLILAGIVHGGCSSGGYREVAVVVMQPDIEKGDIREWVFEPSAGGMTFPPETFAIRPLSEYLFSGQPEIMARARFSRGTARCTAFDAQKMVGSRFESDANGNLQTVNVYAVCVRATFTYAGPGFTHTESFTKTTDYVDPRIVPFNEAEHRQRAYTEIVDMAKINLLPKQERINVAFFGADPSDDDAIGQSIELLREGKYAEAYTRVNALLNATEDPLLRAKLNYNKGLIHEACFELSHALRCYERALAGDPANKYAAYGRTRCRAKLKRTIGDLEKHYRQAGQEFYLKPGEY